MGWLAAWYADDSRGPRNDPAWRERHPECEQPMRLPGTVLDVSPLSYGHMGWLAHPEMYDREPPALLDAPASAT